MPLSDQESLQLALDNCASEPIHIPGKLQSFGGLVGFDAESFEVRYVSDNIDELIGQEGKVRLGKTLKETLDHRQLLHQIRGAMGYSTIYQQRELLGEFQWGEEPIQGLNFALHRSGSLGILEAETIAGAPETPTNHIKLVRSLLSGLDTSHTDALLQSAAKVLRMCTGFDRVMGYRFLQSGDGEVVAEAKSPHLHPFFGLRYPAYDIPPQVRQLALKMPFRVIASTEDQPVGLTSLTDQPLDLTYCVSRAVSPIHIEYLKNMDVGATMNLSIIVHGELWGLFAFHHKRAT